MYSSISTDVVTQPSERPLHRYTAVNLLPQSTELPLDCLPH